MEAVLLHALEQLPREVPLVDLHFLPDIAPEAPQPFPVHSVAKDLRNQDPDVVQILVDLSPVELLPGTGFLPQGGQQAQGCVEVFGTFAERRRQTVHVFEHARAVHSPALEVIRSALFLSRAHHGPLMLLEGLRHGRMAIGQTPG